MKNLLLLTFFIYSSATFANPLAAIESLLGQGVYSGYVENGDKCSVEVFKVSSQMMRIFVFNPRVNRIEINLNDELEYTQDGVRISKPVVVEEDGAKITRTLVIAGRVVGIEREFCTDKCWTSMTPCSLSN